MKKNILIVIATLLVVFIISFSIHLYKIFNYDTQSNNFISKQILKKSMNDDKPSMVLFYSERCTYCIKFMPLFNQLANEFSDKFNFIMLDVENPENKNFAQINIDTLPSLYIFDSKINNKVLLPPSLYYDLELLETEVHRYLRIRSYIDFEKAKKK